ncbi:MAG: DNA polymerase III subunit delta, partial [Alphaproteobacteria bacterium]|nr:DNA polymerase III subunit delta [Alphaproteobacteria bacterium]
MSGGDLRKDPARLLDALKAQSFFPGNRVVFVEEASDSITKIVAPALADWQAGDATLVITAGQLAARSSLRKSFENHKNAYAAAVYLDPPSAHEIEATLKRAGIATLSPEARADLDTLARSLDPGDFAQTMEKLGLYMLGENTPVSSADVAACAPASIEAALDDALHMIAEARVAEIGPMMSRLKGQGVNPTTICIGATRHFRTLHLAASHSGGPEAGLSSARPPVFGPRRDRMGRQARAIGMRKLETVLAILTDTDLGLRSSRPIPARAMLERAFIRIAMLARQ